MRDLYIDISQIMIKRYILFLTTQKIPAHKNNQMIKNFQPTVLIASKSIPEDPAEMKINISNKILEIWPFSIFS